MDLPDRDRLVSTFRQRIYSTTGFVPFIHQAEWQLATEGYTLLNVEALRPDSPHALVRLPDRSVVRRSIIPRIGGVAHNCADLAAYKTGKSYGMAYWASAFAIVPDAVIQFVGLEYSTSEPEFNYLLDLLVSDRGMKMKYSKLHNDSGNGRMILHLRTGATFEVKSWNNRETLKGKRITAYLYTECYQLPGLEVYTTLSQNLRELRGFAIFGTTADRPWVRTLHDFGHGYDTDWHCTCGIDAECNPYTYDQRARDRDDPHKGGMMTKERFAISWEGKLGAFVGRVYDYQRGQKLFTPSSYPFLYNEKQLARFMCQDENPEAPVTPVLTS